jgi:hypothetical protein
MPQIMEAALYRGANLRSLHASFQLPIGFDESLLRQSACQNYIDRVRYADKLEREKGAMSERKTSLASSGKPDRAAAQIVK